MSEFVREVKLDTLGAGPRTLTLTATAEERAALAARFRLVALDRLEATLAVRREGDVVHAEGRFGADVVQACVASGDPLRATIDEPLSLRFAPEADMPSDSEIELSEADLDTLPYSGGAIDLGEAVAEELPLALNPFPRRADADAVLRAAGVLREGEAGPFAMLQGLKDKLGG